MPAFSKVTNYKRINAIYSVRLVGTKERHISLTFLIAGSTLVVSFVVPNILLLFTVMGGTASAAFGFIWHIKTQRNGKC